MQSGLVQLFNSKFEFLGYIYFTTKLTSRGFVLIFSTPYKTTHKWNDHEILLFDDVSRKTCISKF